MQKLRHSERFSGLPDVQSGVPALRRAADSVAWSFTHSRQRVQTAQAGRAGTVAQAWAQRGRDSGVGQGAVTHWPGKGHGVRQPNPCETALSWGEVMHGVNAGLIVGG